MARDDRGGGMVAEASLQAGRLHQVGEDQREQARSADLGRGVLLPKLSSSPESGVPVGPWGALCSGALAKSRRLRGG